jgi:transcriptional regulator GlxA family with amidase domain
MNIHRFGILLFLRVEELDFAGPWETLRMWTLVADGSPECMRAAQSTAPIDCTKGLRVLPHCDFAGCPPLDALLVPGGQGTRQEVHNPALLDFVRRQAVSCELVLSVGTGALVLHAAGLLQGRAGTIYWGALDRLREPGGVTVREQRHVRDGEIWTSAGVSAGTASVWLQGVGRWLLSPGRLRGRGGTAARASRAAAGADRQPRDDAACCKRPFPIDPFRPRR